LDFQPASRSDVPHIAGHIYGASNKTLLIALGMIVLDGHLMARRATPISD